MTIPPISAVMTPSPLSIDSKATLAQARTLMTEKQVRHLPVTEAGKLTSMISDRDATLAIAANKDMQAADHILVEDVCTLSTYTVTPDTPLDEVVTEMAIRHIGSVLIAEDGQLRGIFTVTDTCRLLAECLVGDELG